MGSVNVVRFSPNGQITYPSLNSPISLGECLASASDGFFRLLHIFPLLATVDGMILIWRGDLDLNSDWKWTDIQSDRELKRVHLRLDLYVNLTWIE